MEEIDKILALTDQVQKFVDEGRWTEASELETQRMALLTDLFEREDIAAFGPACETLAKDLLTSNAAMIRTLADQRTRLNETTRKINASPRAMDAYRKNDTKRPTPVITSASETKKEPEF